MRNRKPYLGVLAIVAAMALFYAEHRAEAASMTAFRAEGIHVTNTRANVYTLVGAAGGSLQANQCVKLKAPTTMATTVFVGGNDVTASAAVGGHAYPLAAGDSESPPVAASDVWLIVGTVDAGADLNVLLGNGC